MNKKTLSILCLVSMTVTCFNPLGKEVLANNFSHSCKDFSLDNTTLRAKCKGDQAQYQDASLNLDRGIGNKDGYLGAGRNFSHACTNIELNEHTLKADCETYQKDSRSTSFNLDSVIDNNGGVLVFDH